MLGVTAGSEGVGRGVVDDVDLGHRHARRDRHLVDDVVQRRGLLRADLLGVRARQHELVAAVVGEQSADRADADGDGQGTDPERHFVAAAVADAVTDHEFKSGQEGDDYKGQQERLATVGRFLGIEGGGCHRRSLRGRGRATRRSAALTPIPGLRSQIDDGDLGSLGLGLEELTLGEAQRPGDEDVREDLEGVVEFQDRRVVVLAGERDLVLGRGQLLLQRENVLVGLERRVVLDDGEERAQCSGQDVLGLGLSGRALCARGDGTGARLGDLRQDALLEVHVALDRVDEIRDQVMATLELDLDLGVGLIDAIALRYETVVDPDQDQDQDHQYDDDDDERDHVSLLRSR